MNILVTNDDGWGFAGINRLEIIAKRFGQVWVVAPDQPVSGISHQITFERPMKFVEQAPRSYSLSGTPADCVRVAMSQLDVKFDWVLSGINNGSNLGVDIFVSGTVAAAREATFFGCRAIAFSQYLKGFRDDFQWHLAEQNAERVLAELIASDLNTDEFFNVNFPDTLGEPVDKLDMVYTDFNRHPLPSIYQSLDNNEIIYCGKYKDRQRTDGLDADVCMGGNISITRHRPS